MTDRINTAAQGLGLKRKYVDLGDGSFAEAMSDIMRVSTVTTVVWTNTGVAVDIVPDVDEEIDVAFAKFISIQMITDDPLHTSEDFDVNVMSSLNGTKWDTLPFVERNAEKGDIKTFLVTPSVSKIRLRGDNNEAATTGYASAIVRVVW